MNKKTVLILLSILHICIFSIGIVLIYNHKEAPISLSVASNNTTIEVENENTVPSVIESEMNDIYESVPTNEVETEAEDEAETEMSSIQIEEDENVEQVSEESTESSPLYTFTYSKGTRKLNIRKGPTVDDEIIGKVPPNGTGIIIEFVNDDWALIEYDGIKGYCYLRWMSISEAN